MPKFSVILPVRNGGEYVRECVNSILRQDFPDFELMVLDNCSTDETSTWISALKDPRIRMIPAERPLTIEENWGRIKDLDKSEFITLIGHDDRLEPGYLSEMNRLITANPDASLYQSHFEYIDGEGKKIRDCRPMLERETGPEFLSSCLRQNIDLMGTGFLMRAADYDRIGGIPAYPSLLFADFELWTELTRITYKATSPQKCFAFRIHKSTTSTSADEKMQDAFEKFVHYLKRLKRLDKRSAEVIQEQSGDFLEHYCQGFIHRLLRTPRKANAELSAKRTLEKFRYYAAELGVGKSFHPESNKSIKLALWIDKWALTRNLFLTWKKLFPKPMLK